MKRRKTLRERADAFAKRNFEYVQYDADGYRRVHKTEEFANDSGVWEAGYRVGKKEGKAEAMKACGWGR